MHQRCQNQELPNTLNNFRIESFSVESYTKVALAALFHDASEVLTGDPPTPVKYANVRREVA